MSRDENEREEEIVVREFFSVYLSRTRARHLAHTCSPSVQLVTLNCHFSL